MFFMTKKQIYKARNLWHRKPYTQVAPNKKKQKQKYACRQSRNPLQTF
jgi:hypothetical protein